MIGNKIKYLEYLWDSELKKHRTIERIGVVVDAYTKVKGTYKSNSILGFGEGNGSTESNRIYKIEILLEYTGVKIYEDILSNQMKEIIEYNCKGYSEEKFKSN